MNRIEKTFENLKIKGEKALVGFVSAGDPDIYESFKLIAAMCEAGLDILELGVPFSDPTADGPVIQRSSLRALKNGINLKGVIELTKKIRKKTSIPIILFSYYNPILSYSPKAFYYDAVSAGADGVLVVDLPPEESDEMTSLFSGDELSVIRLIAPTTPKDRISKITASGSGFLYLVSKTGVTGSYGINTLEISQKIDEIRNFTKLPICVGFGISTDNDVKEVSRIADGVVIGSAFEKLIEENLNNIDLASIIKDKVSKYKLATKIIA
ncbi:MAG: tryptophan synthase subunit alpha [Desulfobacterales bacterium]|nr:tryptophan synthase subunit alpha [Desulfobacterales bacterium]